MRLVPALAPYEQPPRPALLMTLVHDHALRVCASWQLCTSLSAKKKAKQSGSSAVQPPLVVARAVGPWPWSDLALGEREQVRSIASTSTCAMLHSELDLATFIVSPSACAVVLRGDR